MKTLLTMSILLLLPALLLAEDRREALAAAEAELAQMQTTLGPRHPQILAKQAAIEQLRAALPPGAQFVLEFKIINVPAEAWANAGIERAGPIGKEDLKRLANLDSDLLSAPKILMLEGQQARIEVAQAPLQYMEASGDVYELKQTDAKLAPGISIDATARGDRDDPLRVDVESKVQVNLLEGRAKVPKVDLPIGMPIIRSRELETRILLKQGQWSVISSVDLDAEGANGARRTLAVLCRAARVGPDGAEPEPDLEIVSDRAEGRGQGETLYSGNVRINGESFSIHTDRAVVTTKPAGKRTNIQSDSVRFDPATGKMHLVGNVVLSMDGAEIGADALVLSPHGGAPGEKPRDLETFLKETLIEQLEFKEAALQDVAHYLVEVSRKQDPEKKGMNVILKTKQADAKITLSLRRVTLLDALRFVTEITGTQYRLDGPAVIIED